MPERPVTARHEATTPKLHLAAPGVRPGAHWSPDGRWLAVSEELGADEASLRVTFHEAASARAVCTSEFASTNQPLFWSGPDEFCVLERGANGELRVCRAAVPDGGVDRGPWVEPPKQMSRVLVHGTRAYATVLFSYTKKKRVTIDAYEFHPLETLLAPSYQGDRDRQDTIEPFRNNTRRIPHPDGDSVALFSEVERLLYWISREGKVLARVDLGSDERCPKDGFWAGKSRIVIAVAPVNIRSTTTDYTLIALDLSREGAAETEVPLPRVDGRTYGLDANPSQSKDSWAYCRFVESEKRVRFGVVDAETLDAWELPTRLDPAPWRHAAAGRDLVTVTPSREHTSLVVSRHRKPKGEVVASATLQASSPIFALLGDLDVSPDGARGCLLAGPDVREGEPSQDAIVWFELP